MKCLRESLTLFLLGQSTGAGAEEPLGSGISHTTTDTDEVWILRSWTPYTGSVHIATLTALHGPPTQVNVPLKLESKYCVCEYC